VALDISGRRILQRCDELARHSETPGQLTRVFLSDQHRGAIELVQAWMREAGMTARLDAIGNVIGRYEAAQQGSPCLMTGSHLDTVRDAGKYDGMLGVIVAIECVHALARAGRRLPFAVEVLGFGDEEGVRFGCTFLGSRAVAGTFDRAVFDAKDRDGTTLAQAMRGFGLDPDRIGEAARARKDVLAFVEVHIEQGPVLEAEGLPVGVVSAINGFSRLAITLKGEAGHAGTVPMTLRRDALAAAADALLAVERIACAKPELVGTVGRIEVAPGALNVIPGEARFTLDVRAPEDTLRLAAVNDMVAAIHAIAARRKITAEVNKLQEQGVTRCADWLAEQLARSISAQGLPVRRLPSGAGHDGMAMRELADIAMLFVRCKGGVSHNPSESVTEDDAATAARVLARFLEDYAPCPR
jgi:allantoate deiminase